MSNTMIAFIAGTIFGIIVGFFIVGIVMSIKERNF